jgi:hypothetical protein
MINIMTEIKETVMKKKTRMMNEKRIGTLKRQTCFTKLWPN